MATTTPIDVPTLIWSRAAGNRRKIWLLGAITILALTPFVTGASDFLAHTFVRATPRAALGWSAAGLGFYEIVVLLSVVQAAGLGLLFWSIAASPTAKLLVEAGASPAGPSERTAREILEQVATAAGLPAPKLYIIESGVPNAFAAGTSSHQAVVAVSRGMLNLLNAEEIEAVLAHEISHIGNEDIRLNTVVASIALFLRIPYLLFRRQLEAGKQGELRGRRSPWRIALSPVGLYIVFVAPLMAAAVRAAVARSREFRADADALQLTGAPRGLLRALAKLGGSGSAMPDCNPAFAHYYFVSPTASQGWFGGSIMATHPPIANRIQQLAGAPGAPSIDSLKEAIEEGRRYTREHPPVVTTTSINAGSRDELASFNRGNPMGRVFRLLAADPVPVYEIPSKQGAVLTRIKPGELIVAFDDPGKMRQVNTSRQNFGYIDRTVKLACIPAMIPAEVYDPVARAAAEAKLAPLAEVAASPAQNAKAASESLSFNQILAAAALGVAVFAGMFLALMKFAH